MTNRNDTDMSSSHRIHAAQAQVEDEQNEIAVIIESNAVVHPRTVVVHPQHTPAYNMLHLSLHHDISSGAIGTVHTTSGYLWVAGAVPKFLNESDWGLQLANVAVMSQGRLGAFAGLAEPHICPCCKMIALQMAEDFYHSPQAGFKFTMTGV